MSAQHHDHGEPQTLAEHVAHHTGEAPSKCYQCGKCSAGCPLAEEMDVPPSRLLRMLQVGFKEYEDKALSSLSIWLCLSCETCYVRCPKEVDLPKIMDYLRGEALRRKKAHPKSKEILAFHRSFLDTVRKGGRLHEIGLIAGYKLRTWKMMQDVGLAPKMLALGKLPIFAHKIKGRKAMEQIFQRTLGKEENE